MRQTLVVLLLLVVGQLAFSQNPGYQLTLTNDAQTSATTYEFDIRIMSDGQPNFELATIQPIMTFNTAISGGTVTLSLVGGTSDLVSAQVPSGLTVAGNELRIASRPPPGAGGGTVVGVSPGVRVGRFRITSSVDFPSTERPNIAWKGLSGGNPYTKVTAYVSASNTDITNESGHINGLVNPLLPVTLVSFTGNASASAGGVVLEWRTASEVNNYGYTVQRKGEGEEAFSDLEGSFAAGHNTTTEPQSYSYVDRTVARAGSYTYRLRQQDLDGTVHYSQSVIVNVTVTDVAEVAPKVFQLMQNYPNPFNPSTQLKFSVETTGRAVMKIYNMLGEEVATLFDGTAEAGRYYVATFNATGLATGIYLYRLTADEKTHVRKMLLVK